MANNSHTPRPSISQSAFSTPAPGTPSGAVSRSYSKAPDATAGPGNAATAIPALPSPATFDVLPQLHILLSRLLIPKPAVGGSQQQQSGGAGGGATSGATTATAGTAAGNAQNGQQGQGGAAIAEQKDPDNQPLEIHQLAAAASTIKVRVQRARQACARLEDVDRTVEEQEEEIRELENKLAKSRAVLEELGVGAAAAEGAV